MAQNSVSDDPVMPLDEKAEGNKFLGKKIHDLFKGEMSIYEIDDFVDDTSTRFKIELTHIGLPSTAGRPLRSKYEGPLSKLLELILYQRHVNPNLFLKDRCPNSPSISASIWTIVRISLQWWTKTPPAFESPLSPDANELDRRNLNIELTRSSVRTVFNVSGKSSPKYHMICLNLKSLDGRTEYLLKMKMTIRCKFRSLQVLASRTVYKAMEDHVIPKKSKVTFESFLSTRDTIVDKNLPKVVFPKCLKEGIQRSFYD